MLRYPLLAAVLPLLAAQPVLADPPPTRITGGLELRADGRIVRLPRPPADRPVAAPVRPQRGNR